jgi:SulP family sulfate permease
VTAPGERHSSFSAARWIPAVQWLSTYRGAWLPHDLVAGITLAAYLLPAALGDASLANLSPQAGLYACLFGGALFWLFCSSRYTTVTTTSAISLLTGASLAQLAGGDVSRFGTLAAATALLVALIAFGAWALRAGAIVSFISESVMVGFKCGLALFLASTQLPKLFGLPATHGDFWQNAGFFARHLRETNSAALAVGLGALAVLALGKVFFRNRPVALFVVAGGIAAAALFALDRRGVILLGDIPRGLPALGIPILHGEDIDRLMALAVACFLLSAVETAAIGRTFNAKHGVRLDANQELLALGAANLAAGFGGGLAIGGGSSQSLVNESAGARTPLSGVVATGFILLVILFFSAPLRLLPQPVLAAVVLSAVTGLFQVSALTHLRRASRGEFVVAVATMIGVLGSGLLRGVAIGAVISLLQMLRRTSQPHVALLGRIPGTRRYSDLERHADNVPVPGVMIFRPEASLFYFNAEGVCDRIRESVAAAVPPPKLVVLDLSASPHVDLQSAQALGALAGELATAGIQVHAVETHSAVRDMLRSQAVDARLGGINRFSTVADVVDRFQGA